jgi:nucleoside-diphosphate-sugar epimerase
MNIALLGATGVVGRNLAPLLVARGHAVRAVVRDPARADALRAAGASVARGDVLDPESLTRAIDRCEVVVNVASAVPRPGSGGAWDANTRIRTEGTRNVIAAARAAGATRVLHQSVAMVHHSVAGRWVDEASALVDHPQTRSAIALEQIVAEGDVDWQIVRGGLFYGPATGREDHYRAAARDGSLRLPGDGRDFVSLVHIADMAAAIVAIVEAGPVNRAWLAVDDTPVTWRDFLGELCRRERVAPPPPGGANYLPSFRCANRRLRALGWSPRYPDFRSGID